MGDKGKVITLFKKGWLQNDWERTKCPAAGAKATIAQCWEQAKMWIRRFSIFGRNSLHLSISSWTNQALEYNRTIKCLINHIHKSFSFGNDIGTAEEELQPYDMAPNCPWLQTSISKEFRAERSWREAIQALKVKGGQVELLKAIKHHACYYQELCYEMSITVEAMNMKWKFSELNQTT